MNHTWRLALRLLRRDKRSGELRVLMLAVVIAVASVSSVGFFTDRIAQALAQQANALLGADMVVAADHPPRAVWLAAARSHALRTAEAQSFLSMTIVGERNQLADVKAVSGGYPLRGELRISSKRFAPAPPASPLPPLPPPPPSAGLPLLSPAPSPPLFSPPPPPRGAPPPTSRYC